MADYTWGLIVSWHIVEEEHRTRCGRYANFREYSDTLPEGRSCESCLRLVASDADVPNGESVDQFKPTVDTNPVEA